VTDDEVLVLAGEFPTPTHADWLAAVGKILRGRSFEEVLQRTTPDGIVIDPLYTKDSEPPGLEQYPGTGTGRRSSNPVATLAGWDIRQRHGLAEDPAAANAAALTDLRRGVTSIELAAPSIDAERLERALRGVYLDLAPVALRTDDDGVTAAQALLALVADAEIQPAEYRADLGCDPIGAVARCGRLSLPVADAVARVAQLAAELARSHPRVRIVRADGSTFAEAGASPAVELGATVASAVTYLRAFTDAGLPVDVALDNVLLTTTVGTEQFGDIAKLRALRVLWSRVASVIGAPEHRAKVQAVTSDFALAQRDPWVNMLRTTIGCFAAAVGGADVITVTPFDAQLGQPDDLGRRVARNTQLALMEESQVHRVADAAGGSWYVEHLTDQLAECAWREFQAIESGGGVVAALQSGELQKRIGVQWELEQARVATRARPITGVSEFANLDEDLLSRARFAGEGATADDAVVDVTPLPARRLAEAFEQLRSRGEKQSPEPVVFLANLGAVATHTARATWAKNFFEAGGIRALGNEGFDDDAELAEAFASSGARIAALCSSDAVYSVRVPAAAAALRAAGAARVYLAGHPGEQREAFVAAGVDEFVHVGCDVLRSLHDAYDLLETGQGDSQ